MINPAETISDLEVLLITQQCEVDIESNPYALSIVEEKLNEIKSISGEPWEFRASLDGAIYWHNIHSKKTKTKCPYLKEILSCIKDRMNSKKTSNIKEEYPPVLAKLIRNGSIGAVYNAIKMEGILAV